LHQGYFDFSLTCVCSYVYLYVYDYVSKKKHAGILNAINAMKFTECLKYTQMVIK